MKLFKTATYLCATALFVPSVALAVPGQGPDADGDTVPDAWDAYPNDPTLAAEAWGPAQNQFGMLLFEDRWPSRGDFDFNDAVIAYNYKYRVNALDRIQSVRVTLNVLALGGTIPLGLGLSFEEALRTSADRIRVAIGNGTPRDVQPIAGDQFLSFVITDDMRRDIFASATGPINSSAQSARVETVPVIVEISFRTPQWLNPCVAPHDLFIFRTNDPGHEIHRSYSGGTSRMNTALFNTADDASSGDRRTFVDSRNVPFAVVLAELSPYPGEGEDLANLYPQILDFAASSGTANLNYYNGTRNLSAAYQSSTGQGMVTPSWGTCIIDPECAPASP